MAKRAPERSHARTPASRLPTVTSRLFSPSLPALARAAPTLDGVRSTAATCERDAQVAGAGVEVRHALPLRDGGEVEHHPDQRRVAAVAHLAEVAGVEPHLVAADERHAHRVVPPEAAEPAG